MYNIVSRDVFLNALVAITAIVLILLLLVNPPAEDAKAEPPGNLIVGITWPVGNVDVDLWLDGPGEEKPVGYSRKSGALWNLLRDDLGTPNDPMPLNFENAYTRGIVAGDYTVNVHCYRCPGPTRIDVEIRLSLPGEPGTRLLVSTNVTLSGHGDEKTVMRFTMDADGNVDRASMHNVFRPLRKGDQ